MSSIEPPYVWNQPQVQAAPLNVTAPGSLEIALQAVTATFDGTGASGAFLPALQIISDAGITLATFVDTSVSVVKGGSAEVTFGTFLRRQGGGTGATSFGGLWGLPAWQTGCFYASQVHGMSVSSFTGANNQLFTYPIWIPEGATTGHIATYVTATGGHFHLGVYADNGFGYPSSLIHDDGPHNVSVTGAATYAYSNTFTAGLYWMSIITDTTTFGTSSYTGSWQTVAATNTLSDYFTGQSVSNYAPAQAYGALPDPFPAGAHPYTTGAGYFVCLQAA